MKLELRDYQQEALARVEAAEERGVLRQLGVAATGLGKTVMFCALAERRGGRALILAHRDELVRQAAAKVTEVWPEARVGIVKAEENDVRADVVVASVQTLARPKRLGQLLAPFSATGGTLLGRAAPFDLVVVDEAHHAAADSYRSILTALRAGEPERAATPEEVDGGCELGVMPAGPLLLGVTATPDRGDGKGLDDLFDEITFNYDILWGIRAGYLSDLRGLRIHVSTLNLADVKVRRGDYDAGQAGAAMETAQAERYVVAAYLEHALGRRTLVFTPTVEVARLIAEEFVAAGISAAYVHGGTPTEERRRILADYSAGRIEVVANCAVLTEGYDEPRTDCIIVARPTRSRALYTQMVGRGTRRHPDKADCLVLDVVGASDDLSLVTVPSLFGLDKKFADRVGAEGVAGLAQEQDDELVRLGRMRAEEADLFRQMRREGLAWVAIHQVGDPLRRYVISLPKVEGEEQPLVVLAQREEGADVWTAGLQYPTGEKRVLMAMVSQETAQGVAEDYVRRNARGAATLLDTNAEWRKRKPTKKAVAAAKAWKLTVDPAWTAGELSDALNAHIARIKSRPRKGARS